MTDMTVTFILNGQSRTQRVATSALLIDHLHDEHGARGAKIGCSRGVCGACTVLLDGRPAAACSVFAFQVDGRDVVTIEGISADANDPVQQAFADHAAFQCGYCTPGMILLVKAMLAHHRNPDRSTIVEWLSSNVCRCTGYLQIIAAVEDIVAKLNGAAP
jgi:aerobic carbon-monoxide dehydrogenase small subunit